MFLTVGGRVQHTTVLPDPGVVATTGGARVAGVTSGRAGYRTWFTGERGGWPVSTRTASSAAMVRIVWMESSE